MGLSWQFREPAGKRLDDLWDTGTDTGYFHEVESVGQIDGLLGVDFLTDTVN
jgi:hypothetical protein